MISQWKKDELREKLKKLKKSVDDTDRSRKALIIQKVYNRNLEYIVVFVKSDHRIVKVIINYSLIVIVIMYNRLVNVPMK